MALILDTNALSAIADGETSAGEVVAKPDRIAVPVIVLGEYRLGIAQSRHHATYEAWLQEFIAAVIVLSVDEETAHSYSSVALDLRKKGKPIPTNDLWIAALCRQHSMPLLSRDRHFDAVPGLRRVEW